MSDTLSNTTPRDLRWWHYWPVVLAAHLAVFTLSFSACLGWFFGLRMIVRAYTETGFP